MTTTERRRGRELAFAVWMLAWVALAAARREVLWCSLGGLLGLGARLVAARGTWTPSGRFGAANSVTALRLILVASLGVWFVTLPRFAFIGLVLVLFALDGLDGWLART